MILPIVAYGHPTLKKVAEDIDADYPGLDELIANMFETMYASNGIGLAAPQVNQSIRLFIIDASPLADDHPELATFRKIFLNPYIIEDSGEIVTAEEGCLSIPNIRENVDRHDVVVLEYYDENWNFFEERFDGIKARIIQHEYDHLEGVLFIEKISTLRRTLLTRKLKDITNGNISVDYRMLFPAKKKLKVT
ncbi:MAG: peptide deformylase [Bacteroidales bacterium]|nr:peptide deformylase [Bacteroidales bacterium]